MSTGVAITANNRHARLRQAEFRANNVNNTLSPVSNIVERNPRVLAVLAESLYLLRCDLVLDNEAVFRRGWHVVVDSRERQVGPAHLPACKTESLERLWRRDFVHEMKVDVNEGRFAGSLSHEVRRPDFLE
jgi:hypothetical protein